MALNEFAPYIHHTYAVALLKTNLPAFFSCANDYSDLAGETAIMENILGANFLLRGRASPFKAVTMMTADEKKQTNKRKGKGRNNKDRGADQSWSCSSSFMYTVQGQRSGGNVPDLETMRSAPKIGKKIVGLFTRMKLPLHWDKQGLTGPSLR